MPKFSVIVTRDTTESTVIEVDASTAEKAEEMAIEISHIPGRPTVWEQDDTPNASKEHYTNGAERIG